jgi:hypothetical protein
MGTTLPSDSKRGDSMVVVEGPVNGSSTIRCQQRQRAVIYSWMYSCSGAEASQSRLHPASPPTSSVYFDDVRIGTNLGATAAQKGFSRGDGSPAMSGMDSGRRIGGSRPRHRRQCRATRRRQRTRPARRHSGLLTRLVRRAPVRSVRTQTRPPQLTPMGRIDAS